MNTKNTDSERYAWFRAMGWKVPVLNTPDVIHREATPERIDQLIDEGMVRWPVCGMGVAPNTPLTPSLKP